tara:strand:- start:1165 stop:1356 length:192 start_codon:yes stop_codon:yes gene_type:complete
MIDREEDIELLKSVVEDAVVKIDSGVLAMFVDGYVNSYMDRERILELRKKRGKLELERIYEDE